MRPAPVQFDRVSFNQGLENPAICSHLGSEQQDCVLEPSLTGKVHTIETCRNRELPLSWWWSPSPPFPNHQFVAPQEAAENCENECNAHTRNCQCGAQMCLLIACILTFIFMWHKTEQTFEMHKQTKHTNKQTHKHKRMNTQML